MYLALRETDTERPQQIDPLRSGCTQCRGFSDPERWRVGTGFGLPVVGAAGATGEG